MDLWLGLRGYFQKGLSKVRILTVNMGVIAPRVTFLTK